MCSGRVPELAPSLLTLTAAAQSLGEIQAVLDATARTDTREHQ